MSRPTFTFWWEMMVSGECISIWENGRSRQYLEEPYFEKWFRRKTQKKDISSNIVTSEHDMSWLVRKFRGSEDMPQRSIQTHAYIPKQRILRRKSFNSFGHNLQLPSNHDRFEDGNHQKQVTILYRIICLKKATNFVVTNNCLSCFQKAVLICFPPSQATDN